MLEKLVIGTGCLGSREGGRLKTLYILQYLLNVSHIQVL